MSPDEMRVKIAEACGWRIANPENDRHDYRMWIPPGAPDLPNHAYLDKPPNYPHDLNACHEMERVGLVTPELRKAYVNELDVITGANNQDSWSECLYCGFTATALQRCEAFLRTLGKWPDPNLGATRRKLG